MKAVRSRRVKEGMARTAEQRAEERIRRRDEAERKRMELVELERRGEVALELITASLAFTDDLLSTTFSTGDGRKVRWGDATVADHRKRVEWMQKHIGACEDDMALHEEAITLLQRSRVATLWELRRRDEEA